MFLKLYLRPIQLRSLAIMIALCGIVCEIFLFAFLQTGDGDDGVYIATTYLVGKGYVSFIDFWNPQGIGYGWATAPFGMLFGYSLLSQRILFAFFSLGILAYSIKIVKYWSHKLNLENLNLLFFLSLLIGLLSIDFWQDMSQIGTKSSLVVLLIVGSLYHLVRGIEDFSWRHVAISVIQSAFLATIKYTLATVNFFVLVTLLWMAVKNRKFLFTFLGAAFLTMVVILAAHFPILSQRGLDALLLSFKVAKNEYRVREIMQSKTWPVFEFSKYLIFKLMFIWFGLVVMIYSGIRRRFWYSSEFLFARIFVCFSMVHLSLLAIFLYPVLSTRFVNMVYPFLTISSLFLIVAAAPTRVDTKKMRYIYLGGIAFFGIFFAKNLSFVRMVGVIDYGRFHRITTFQEFKEQLLGENKIVDKLNELKDSRAVTEYVYIGRGQNIAINSRLNLAPISGAGTALVEAQNPPREIANRVGAISMTNLDEIIEHYQVFVIERDRFAFAGYYQEILDAIKKHHLILQASMSDLRYEVYLKM